MDARTVALFGEAEEGEFKRPYLFTSLEQMVTQLGNPPPETQGLTYAVQTVMFGYRVLYFRVREEGFACGDYLSGLQYLKAEGVNLSALCLPGVGDAEIIDATSPICETKRTLLILTEADLFDYLTS